MMKCVFALVVLLHFSYSYKSNKTLNTEIIGRLDTLNGLYRDNKVNITSPDTMRIPTTDMNAHASSCVSVFVRELRHLLDNVTVHEESEHILQELEANLQALDPHQQTDPKCRLAHSRKSLTPFRSYANFLRNLTNSPKR